MVELVAKYRIATPSQRRHHSRVRHIAGGKQQCAGKPGETRQRFFQRMMCARVPTDEMRGARTGSISPRARASRFDQARIVCKPEIIVAAKREAFASVYPNMGILGAFQHETAAKQIPCLAAAQLFAQLLNEIIVHSANRTGRSDWTGLVAYIERSPSLSNSALSRSASGLPVVSSLS